MTSTNTNRNDKVEASSDDHKQEQHSTYHSVIRISHASTFIPHGRHDKTHPAAIAVTRKSPRICDNVRYKQGIIQP